MAIFDFLNGMSPWYWVALAFGLGALEMATMSFFLIWPALAALTMGGLLAASPNMTAETQVISFAVLAVLLTVIGRYLFTKYGDGGEVSETLNKRSAHFIGRTGAVLEFANTEGVIELEGMRWRAKWIGDAGSAKGDKVRVTDVDGMVLHVEPI